MYTHEDILAMITEAGIDNADPYFLGIATGGDAELQEKLGAEYLEDKEKGEKPHLKAAILFKIASQKGRKNAQSYLAHMYYNGLGVEQDKPKAIGLFRLAAQQGAASAQVFLAELYQTGREGFPRDIEEAIPLAQLAAAQGSVEGQYRLATLLYQKGTDGRKNEERRASFKDIAIKLFTLAARQNHVLA